MQGSHNPSILTRTPGVPQADRPVEGVRRAGGAGEAGPGEALGSGLRGRGVTTGQSSNPSIKRRSFSTIFLFYKPIFDRMIPVIQNV